MVMSVVQYSTELFCGYVEWAHSAARESHVRAPGRHRNEYNEYMPLMPLWLAQRAHNIYISPHTHAARHLPTYAVASGAAGASPRALPRICKPE